MDLETVDLCGETYVRPSGFTGSCGFYPKAWTIAKVRKGKSYKESFLAVNTNWTEQEIN